MFSAAKQDHIEKTVAYHMGELRCSFESGNLNEELLCNMDETHFVINCDNGRTFGFRGDTEVKYADVGSGGIGITMTVYIAGGSRAQIGAPMTIFQIVSQSYPIDGLSDDVPDPSYRYGPKGWNNKKGWCLMYHDLSIVLHINYISYTITGIFSMVWQATRIQGRYCWTKDCDICGQLCRPQRQSRIT